MSINFYLVFDKLGEDFVVLNLEHHGSRHILPKETLIRSGRSRSIDIGTLFSANYFKGDFAEIFVQNNFKGIHFEVQDGQLLALNVHSMSKEIEENRIIHHTLLGLITSFDMNRDKTKFTARLVTNAEKPGTWEELADKTEIGLVVQTEPEYLVWTAKRFTGFYKTQFVDVRPSMGDWIEMSFSPSSYERYFPETFRDVPETMQCDNFRLLDKSKFERVTMNNNIQGSVRVSVCMKVEEGLSRGSHLIHPIFGALRDSEKHIDEIGCKYYIEIEYCLTMHNALLSAWKIVSATKEHAPRPEDMNMSAAGMTVAERGRRRSTSQSRRGRSASRMRFADRIPPPAYVEPHIEETRFTRALVTNYYYGVYLLWLLEFRKPVPYEAPYDSLMLGGFYDVEIIKTGEKYTLKRLLSQQAGDIVTRQRGPHHASVDIMIKAKNQGAKYIETFHSEFGTIFDNRRRLPNDMHEGVKDRVPVIFTPYGFNCEKFIFLPTF